jgi:hypothetical protein
VYSSDAALYKVSIALFVPAGLQKEAIQVIAHWWLGVPRFKPQAICSTAGCVMWSAG